MIDVQNYFYESHASSIKIATLLVSAISHRKKYEVPRNELSRKNRATTAKVVKILVFPVFSFDEVEGLKSTSISMSF